LSPLPARPVSRTREPPPPRWSPCESGLAHAGVADDNDDTAAASCGIIQGSRQCLQFSIATSKDWAEQRLH
jgi:hypothetical protein